MHEPSNSTLVCFIPELCTLVVVWHALCACIAAQCCGAAFWLSSRAPDALHDARVRCCGLLSRARRPGCSSAAVTRSWRWTLLQWRLTRQLAARQMQPSGAASRPGTCPLTTQCFLHFQRLCLAGSPRWKLAICELSCRSRMQLEASVPVQTCLSCVWMHCRNRWHSMLLTLRWLRACSTS